jgi:hypothetical protein
MANKIGTLFARAEIDNDNQNQNGIENDNQYQ